VQLLEQDAKSIKAGLGVSHWPKMPQDLTSNLIGRGARGKHIPDRPDAKASIFGSHRIEHASQPRLNAVFKDLVLSFSEGGINLAPDEGRNNCPGFGC